MTKQYIITEEQKDALIKVMGAFPFNQIAPAIQLLSQLPEATPMSPEESGKKQK